MLPLKSISYSIPYLLVLTSFFVIYFLNRPQKKILSDNQTRIICCGIFLFFFGFRGLVGWDWYNYMPSFISGQDLSDTEDSTSDYGFVMYSFIVRQFTNNYQCFVFINTLIDVIVINYIFKKYSSYYALSFATFMVVSLGSEIDTIRNMKSIEVFLVSLSFIQQRELLRFMLCMILAISLHASAVLFIPFYFYGTKNLARKYVLWIIVLGNIVYLAQLQFIKPIAELIANFIGGRISLMTHMYFSSELFSSARGLSPSYIERLLTSILVYVYYNKLIRLKPTNLMFINLFLTYVIVSLFMAEIAILFYRVGAMFVISYWIIWPALIKCFKFKNNRRIYLIGLITVSYLFVYVRSNTVLYKYDNICFGIRNYEERVIIRDWAAPILSNGNQ